MKNYRITVNGTAYDVVVEDLEEGAVAAAPAAPAAPVAPAAPKKPVTPAAPKKKAAAGGQGSIKISSPMPGKILAVTATVGEAVSRGDVIVVLEAMKMENEIVAPQDGTIASIDVSEGAAVEAGDVLASMN